MYMYGRSTDAELTAIADKSIFKYRICVHDKYSLYNNHLM